MCATVGPLFSLTGQGGRLYSNGRRIDSGAVGRDDAPGSPPETGKHNAGRRLRLHSRRGRPLPEEPPAATVAAGRVRTNPTIVAIVGIVLNCSPRTGRRRTARHRTRDTAPRLTRRAPPTVTAAPSEDLA